MNKLLFLLLLSIGLAIVRAIFGSDIAILGALVYLIGEYHAE